MKTRRLSFHPEASPYDRIWRKSAHGPVLLLLNDVNPKFNVLLATAFGAMVRLSVYPRRVALVAVVAVAALIPHVPEAHTHVRVGAYVLKLPL